MNQNFGQYQVIAEIGRGGMGVIYKALDPRLNRFVAIKELVLDQVEAEKKDEFTERFRREAILAAGMNHPNLISIYDVSIESDHSYYVMELLEGHSLRQELELRPSNRMTAEDFLPMFKEVCVGLSHAHGMNLVHRDIKPDNIFLLQNGKVKITDFGIARSSEADNSNLTKPGVMLGTLSYVSPEQLQDARNVDHRADIYSLAVVAYEVLAGQVPHAGDGLTSTLMAIVSREAQPINELNPEITAEVACVVAKAMRKQAAERYLSVTEFERDMEKAVALGKPVVRETMLRSKPSAGPSSTTYAPGIPMGEDKSQAKPLGQLQSEGGFRSLKKEDSGKALVKPWLAGRTSSPSINTNASQSTSLVKPIAQIGRQGEEKGCFMEPGAIAVRSGRIVVSDTVFRRFIIFGKDGRYAGETKTITMSKETKTRGGAFSKPAALAIDSKGRIIASDSTDQFIRVFDSHGVYMKDLQCRNAKEGGILGLCVDEADLLYASDPDNGCIQVMQIDSGTWLNKIGSKGIAEGQLQLPQGIVIDKKGQLLVVDYGTSKINVYNKSGAFLRSFGSKGNGPGQFNVPRGITIDKQERIYVSDSLNHRVQVFEPNGAFLYAFGGRGSETGRFSGPSDLAMDIESNYLYVVDRGNCRVQVFELRI